MEATRSSEIVRHIVDDNDDQNQEEFIEKLKGMFTNNSPGRRDYKRQRSIDNIRFASEAELTRILTEEFDLRWKKVVEINFAQSEDDINREMND